MRAILHRHLDRWRGANRHPPAGRGPRAALSSSNGIQVRPAREEDAEAIAALYCDSLGTGYASAEGIADELRGRARCAFYVAEQADGGVVGAANAIWLPREEVPDVGVIGFAHVQREILALGRHARRLGLLENVAVRPANRGRGVGTALVEARLAWFRRESAGFAYSFAWKTPHGCPSEGILVRTGFRRVRELPDFYLEDGLANGYACPFCGARCHCSTILFVRTVDD